MTIKTLRRWAGLVGAPMAWLAQVMLSETLSSYACYPHRTPLTAPLWSHIPLIVAAIDVACLGAGAVCAAITWAEWRDTRRKAGPHGDYVIESGESRDGFLVMLSAMSSFIFLVAMLFTSLAVIFVSPCGKW
jgi:hypothetical protein